MKQTIVVVGAGAVGLSLGSYLLHAGHDVVFVVRRPLEAVQEARIEDEIGGRTIVVPSIDVRDVSGMPQRPEALFVCTRGEDIASTLAALAGKIDPACPIVVPGVTFDDLDEIARASGLTNPMVRWAVGFGALKKGPGHYLVFPTTKLGSAMALESGGPKAISEGLARTLAQAGMPTHAFPSALLRWSLRVVNGLQIPFLLAWRRAGWDLERLRKAPPLLAECTDATQEVSRIMRGEAGPIGWVVGILPRWAFALLVRNVASRTSARIRELFLLHGPKIEAQIGFNAEQLFATALRHGSSTRALSALAGISTSER